MGAVHRPRGIQGDVPHAHEAEQRAAVARFVRGAAAKYHGSERRGDRRLGYSDVAGVVVQLHHPGGSVANFLVRPRNLSSTGIGYLHGSFVYKGTACLLIMKTVDHRTVCVAGKVVRCQFIGGTVHEIGVQFEEPIRVSNFIVSIPTDERQQHSTELPRLKGSMLYIEDSINDQELMRFMLANLGVELRTVSNGMEALQLAEAKTFDIVVTSVMLPGMSGPELAQELRGAGYTGPIVALTADEREETRAAALALGCTRVLVKPFNFDVMSKLLGELLPSAAAAEPELKPLVSAHWSNEAMRPLIVGFLGRLEEDVKRIEPLLGEPAVAPVLEKLCLDLKGSAGGYGYPQIGEAAMRLHALCSAQEPREKLTAQYQELARLAAVAGLMRRAEIA